MRTEPAFGGLQAVAAATATLAVEVVDFTGRSDYTTESHQEFFTNLSTRSSMKVTDVY